MGKIVQLYSRFHNGEEGYEEWPTSPSQAVITDPDTGKTLYETLIEVFQALDDIEGLDVPTLLSDLEDGGRVTTLEGYFTNGKAKTAILADKATADANGNNIASTYITKSVNDLTNYYLKSQTYTKDEVNDLVGAVSQFQYEVDTALPTASAATMFKIYLIPSEEPKEGNIKDEFITIQNGSTYSWEQIGSTAVDLSGYSTTEQMTEAINTALASYATTEAVASAISTALSDYYTKDDVDDALSSYTTTEALTTLLAAKASQSDLTELASQLSGKQSTSERTTVINSYSTDSQYPTAKATKTYVDAEKQRALNAEQSLRSSITNNASTIESLGSGKEDNTNKVSSIDSDSTDSQYPSAKAVNDFVEEKVGNAIQDINNTIDSLDVNDCVFGYYSNASGVVGFFRDSTYTNKINGVGTKLYIDMSTNMMYRYEGNDVYSAISSKPFTSASYDSTNQALVFNFSSGSVTVPVGDLIPSFLAGQGIRIDNGVISTKDIVLTEQEYDILGAYDEDTFYFTYEDENGETYYVDGTTLFGGYVEGTTLFVEGTTVEGTTLIL